MSLAVRGGWDIESQADEARSNRVVSEGLTRLLTWMDEVAYVVFEREFGYDWPQQTIR